MKKAYNASPKGKARGNAYNASLAGRHAHDRAHFKRMGYTEEEIDAFYERRYERTDLPGEIQKILDEQEDAA